MSTRLVFRFSGAILLWAAAATPADATGYWNLPSSFYQGMGYGCGAGYHAPLVLGPISCDGWLATNERRLPHAPAPYGAACGCSNGFQFSQPTMMEPATYEPGQQLIVPAHQPTSRKHRPLFLR